MKKENVLLLSLDERWQTYRLQFKTCRKEFSNEALHDLRVATRRLLAVLDIARTLAPRPHIQKIRRILKGQLDSLDDLRDVQVMLADSAKLLENQTAASALLLLLTEKEKRLLRTARKEIKNFKAGDLKKRMERVRAVVEKSVRAAGYEERLLGAVDQAFGRANQLYGQMDAAQPATIHKLRIAFKKFRYMTEIVHPLLPEYPKTLLEYMREYQNRMGDIQDVTILINTIHDLTEAGADLGDIISAQRALEQHRQERIAACMENKEELFTFWRARPDLPFPWEKANEPIHYPSRYCC